MKKFMMSMLVLVSGANMFGAGRYAQNLWQQGTRCFTNLRQQAPHAWSRVRQSPYALPVAMGAGLGGLAYYGTRSASADEGQEQSTAPSLQNRFANWANRLSAQIEPALRRNLRYAYDESSFGDSVTSADLYGQELQDALRKEAQSWLTLRQLKADRPPLEVLQKATSEYNKALIERMGLENSLRSPQEQAAFTDSQKTSGHFHQWAEKDIEMAKNKIKNLEDGQSSDSDKSLAYAELKKAELMLELMKLKTANAPKEIIRQAEKDYSQANYELHMLKLWHEADKELHKTILSMKQKG